jgi:hypothetical protein
MSDHYQALERDLLKVLAEVGSEFEPAEIQGAQMYLDAGEYGLALETICAVLAQKRRPISAETYVSIEDLGARMDVDPSSWQDLEVS